MKRLRRGFTIIEMIIVISITMIIGAVGMSSYGKFTNQNKLDGEVKRLIDTFVLVQKKASAADLSASSCTSPAVFKGFRVSVTISSYQTSIHCHDATAQPPSDTYQTIDSYTFPSPIVSATANSVEFDDLSPTVIFGDNSTQFTFILNHPTLNQSRCINISSTGIIQQVTCP